MNDADSLTQPQRTRHDNKTTPVDEQRLIAWRQQPDCRNNSPSSLHLPSSVCLVVRQTQVQSQLLRLAAACCSLPSTSCRKRGHRSNSRRDVGDHKHTGTASERSSASVLSSTALLLSVSPLSFRCIRHGGDAARSVRRPRPSALARLLQPHAHPSERLQEAELLPAVEVRPRAPRVRAVPVQRVRGAQDTDAQQRCSHSASSHCAVCRAWLVVLSYLWRQEKQRQTKAEEKQKQEAEAAAKKANEQAKKKDKQHK